LSIRSIILGLAAANVDFVLVGMAAGQLHGSRLLTEDVDIVYSDDPANVAHLAAYLNDIDAYVSELWPSEGFAAEFSVDRLLFDKSLTLGSKEGPIDVLHRIDGVGGYDEVLASSEPIDIDGIRLRVITIDGLIQSKRAAQRPKDNLHLPDLECVKELKERAHRKPKPPDRCSS
jgi:predicted nucleotidyltransferase